MILDHSYHGATSAVVEISCTKFDGPGGKGPAPYIHKVNMPDSYRGPIGYDEQNSGEKYAEDATRILKELKDQGKAPAAFICESMPACGGMTLMPPGFLKKVYSEVRAAGGYCIADEVQVGFGRIGAPKWWAFELSDVVPDMVVIGKPMGNGHPVSALIVTEEIA